MQKEPINNDIKFSVINENDIDIFRVENGIIAINLNYYSDLEKIADIIKVVVCAGYSKKITTL